MKKKTIDTVDLFCGCGGLSLGFQNAGFSILAAFDNWDEAIGVYKQNFSHPIYKRDLSDVSDINDISNFHPSLIIGGPPCQDFSSAGHRDESLGRANLTISFAEVVCKIRPKYFVMENVPTIQKSEKLKTVITLFKQAGYGITKRVLDASLCGVPQARKRYIVIGALNAEDGFLDAKLEQNLSSKRMTLYDYFGTSLGFEYYFPFPFDYLP